MLHKYLPGWDSHTVRQYYLSEAAVNLWFIAPVWYFIFRHYLSVQEIGLNEIIVFTIGFMAEIPSGAFADKFGRRKTLVLAGALLTVGTGATGLANSFTSLVMAQAIVFIGYAFYSGANEALVYDQLIAEKREDLWGSISSRRSSLTVLATVVAVIIGGFLYRVNFRLPFLVHTLAMLLFTIMVLRYPKDESLKVINKSAQTVAEYWRDLKRGARELLRPQLRFLLWGVLASAAIYQAYTWGVLRPIILSNHGFEGFSASILSFIMNGLLFLLYLMLPRLFGKSVSEKTVLRATLVAALSYILFSFGTGIWLTGVVVIVFSLLSKTVEWWISIYINRHIASRYRATALSTWAMFEKIPYVLLVGVMTNLSSAAFSKFIIVTGLAMVMSAGVTLLLLPKVDPTLS